MFLLYGEIILYNIFIKRCAQSAAFQDSKYDIKIENLNRKIYLHERHFLLEKREFFKN